MEQLIKDVLNQSAKRQNLFRNILQLLHTGLK